MMPVTLYHGTSDLVANNLSQNPSTVSVLLGGGELGRGSYAGESIALAASWSRGRLSQTGMARVLEIEISSSAYVGLTVKTLNWQPVFNTWRQLQKGANGEDTPLRLGLGSWPLGNHGAREPA